MKCGGTGRIDRFSHYAHGTCFECKGTGEVAATNAVDFTDEHEPHYESPNDLYACLEAQDDERYEREVADGQSE